jgi:hypothetical protein
MDQQFNIFLRVNNLTLKGAMHVGIQLGVNLTCSPQFGQEPFSATTLFVNKPWSAPTEHKEMI